jgi:phytoene dehydrogenase-like protein
LSTIVILEKKPEMAEDKSIIIIGAGFAGLGSGIYACMNGYKAEVFEMHDRPGGLCTSWKRKDFTIDGCIHWLVGSSPESGMHRMWEEVGIAKDREFINMDEYMRYESIDGRVLTFYTDVNRLEKHLLEFSPRDAAVTAEFINGIKMCIPFDQPSEKDPFFRRTMKTVRNAMLFIMNGRKLQKWMKTTAEEFCDRFQDPVMKRAFGEIWIPEFSMLFMLFTFAYLHNKNAGYPVGGSLPMSKALESRFRELGGIIHYGKRVEKIITEGDKAVGIRLDDGTEHRSPRIISAADGYNTIFNMLDGNFTSEKIHEQYRKWPTFPPLIFIGLGINRTFRDVPFSVSGFSFELKEPVELAGKTRESLSVHIFNHDPTLAPEGKTSLTVMLEADYDYWKKLSGERSAYDLKKKEIADSIIGLLEQRFPGISSQILVTDVATPVTFERYTGNWKGSFEGWLITPENANVLMKPMSQKLPGLSNFYMCGQWVEPGGGLPTSIMSAKRLIKSICREDNVRFVAHKA